MSKDKGKMGFLSSAYRSPNGLTSAASQILGETIASESTPTHLAQQPNAVITEVPTFHSLVCVHGMCSPIGQTQPIFTASP
jgi:hypothetical protein